MIKTCSLLLQESQLVFYIAACSMNKSTYVLIHVLCDYLIPVPVNYSNLSGQSFCYCLKCSSHRHNYLPQYTCISLRLSSLYNYHSFSSYCLLYCLYKWSCNSHMIYLMWVHDEFVITAGTEMCFFPAFGDSLSFTIVNENWQNGLL